MRSVSAICSGIAASVLSGVVFAAAFHGLNSLLAGSCLLVGFLVTVKVWASTSKDISNRFGYWDIIVLSIFALASFRAFFWLIYPDGDRILILSPHNLGDISLHVGLIRHFASGVPFWPDNLIFAGRALAYPPGADLWNSLLFLVGMDVRSGLIVTGFGMALLGGWALWKFGGAFCVAGFLFGGGLLGFVIFRNGALVDFTNDAIWKNPFLAMLVTQRGFLFALPAGLVLLDAWRKEFFTDETPCLPLGAQVLLYSTLPLLQVHTFLFLSLLLAAALVFQPKRWVRPVRLVGLSFLPAVILMSCVTGGFSSGTSLRFEPLWAAPGGALRFLLEFGVVISLGAVVIFLVLKSPDVSSRWLVGTSAFIALGAFLFPLHPWSWDNTKLMIWSWIVILPSLWKHVFVPLSIWPRAALCVLLFFTGVISLYAGLDRRHGYELASRSELATWQHLTNGLPANTVFAAEPEYNHPLILLGKTVVCGYDGHLFSHAIPYEGRLKILREVLELGPHWNELANDVGASFVAIREKDGVPPQLLPIRTKIP